MREGDAPSAIEQIQGLLPSLRKSDARVATVLLERRERVGLLSVTDVAALAETSESTVVRACQRLGFRGFHDAKRLLTALDPVEDVTAFEDVLAEDSSGQVLEKVITSSAQVLRNSLTTLDRSAFAGTVAALRACERVLVVGVGPSNPIAQDAAYRLRLVGMSVDAPADALTQHLAAGHLRAPDVCVVVSHTGATREVLASASAAKTAGAVVVAITSFARSPLTEISDFALVSAGQGSGAQVEAMASRLAHLAVVDAVYVDLVRDESPETRAAVNRSRDIATDHQY